MLKIVSVTAQTVFVCATPSLVPGADFDGSKPLLRATIDAHFCDVGEVCYRTLPTILGAPQFIRINFAKKAVVGPQRPTEILHMEPSDGHVLLQGTELGYTWSVALDTKTSAMSTTPVNREDVFVLFGSYTPF
jgi:hypothetical protein